MTYGLSASDIAAVTGRGVERIGAWKITYANADGTTTVERATHVNWPVEIAGESYAYDRTIKGGDFSPPRYTLNYIGRKSAYFDAAGNHLSAKVEVFMAVRLANGTHRAFRIFSGISKGAGDKGGAFAVTFLDENDVEHAIKPFILSRQAQRDRDETDSALDRVSDFASTDFGRQIR